MKRYRVVITAVNNEWKRDRICNRPILAPGPCSAAMITMHKESEWAESWGDSIAFPVIWVYNYTESGKQLGEPVAVYEMRKGAELVGRTD